MWRLIDVKALLEILNQTFDRSYLSGVYDGGNQEQIIRCTWARLFLMFVLQVLQLSVTLLSLHEEC